MFYGNASWIKKKRNDKKHESCWVLYFPCNSFCVCVCVKRSLISQFFPFFFVSPNTERTLNRLIMSFAKFLTNICMKWRLIGSLVGKPLIWHWSVITPFACVSPKWNEGCNFYRSQWLMRLRPYTHNSERQLVICVTCFAPKEKTKFINNNSCAKKHHNDHKQPGRNEMREV